MQEQLKLRSEELKQEFEIGHTRLQELERQQANLRETLLRISGAIQVLDELLAKSVADGQDHSSPAVSHAASNSTN